MSKKNPVWLEDALEEHGQKIIDDELDAEAVVELTGLSQRRSEILLETVTSMGATASDDGEEEEAPAPKKKASKKKAKPAPEPEEEDDEEDEEDEDLEEEFEDEEDDDSEEEAPTKSKKTAKAAKPTKSEKAYNNLAPDGVARLKGLYKLFQVDGAHEEELNTLAEQRFRESVEYDLGDTLTSVTVLDCGAKWMTVRLNLSPEAKAKGKKSEEEIREKASKELVKELKAQLKSNDQAKIYKINLAYNADGSAEMDVQLSVVVK